MCLTINENYHKGKVNLTQGIVTDTDIQVWKCLDDKADGYFTPYVGKEIKFSNGIATQSYRRFTWGDNKKTSIARGIHSFSEEFEASRVAMQFHHSCNTKKFYAVIPKGSHIFIGIEGDIVSDKLLIFESDMDFRYYKIKHDVISVNKFFGTIVDGNTEK